MASCSNINTISSVTSHLSSAICLLKAEKTHQTNDEEQVLQIRKRPAPNANSEKQIRFQSTKKRVSLSRWAKPTTEEEERVKENMSMLISIEVCGVCLKEDDQNEEYIVLWIECEN